jgi:endonuclease YncB( thermonuclease family)
MKKAFKFNIKDIVSVTDGDTCTMNVDLGFKLTYKVNVRVSGIDTPEKSTPEGKIVKKKVEEWFTQGSDFTLESHSLDKYGRVLGDIRNGKNVSLSAYLIDNQLGRYYKGDKKVAWTKAEIENILKMA